MDATTAGQHTRSAMAQDVARSVRFTVFRQQQHACPSTTGASADGDLETLSGTQFSSGSYHVFDFDAADPAGALAEIGQMIDKLSSKQAIGLGVPLNGTMKGHHRHQGSRTPRATSTAIPRSLEYFGWPESRPAAARRRRHRRIARNPERTLSALCRGCAV